jgi:Ca2+/Na+ antiporter
MSVYLPGWLWFFAAAALYLFYALNRSRRIRNRIKQERLEEKQEEIMELLRKKKDEVLKEGSI